MLSTLALFLQRPLEGPVDGMMRGAHPRGFLPFGFFFGGLGTALWAALIVLLVLWIAKNWASPKNPLTAFARRASAAVQASSTVPSVTQTPLEVLQTRYAKGEITREEYLAIRSDLSGEAPPMAVPPVAEPSGQA